MEQLEITYVDIDSVTPNPWNPNVQSADMFDKTIASICAEGFVDPCTVRSDGNGGYEIIDGEHRWDALKKIKDEPESLIDTSKALLDDNESLQEMLADGTVPVVDLGLIDDDMARRLTLQLNGIRGENDDSKLAAVVQQLKERSSLKDLASRLPQTENRLEELLNKKVFATIEPPNDFPEYGDDIDTQYKCPKCQYEWSGSPN